MAKPQKERRLTDLMNVALSTASSAIALMERAPEPQAAELRKKARDAIEDAEILLVDIMRAAEKI